VIAPDGQVLVLERPARGEVRLPKGHVEAGETPRQAALREVAEESGFRHLRILADLGTQQVAFDYQGRHYERTEHYFLMLSQNAETPETPPEAQFIPRWLPWEEAERALTFEAERRWLRRARASFDI